MKLPEDCHLGYVIAHEAWYGEIPGVINGPRLSITATSRGGGAAWEFIVEERDHGRSQKPIRLGIFDEAFVAFEQIPEFFKTLSEVRPSTLAEVVEILNRLGAVDETEYDEPASISGRNFR